MTDQTVSWVKFQKALTPDKPFFIYYAPGAVHAPHHVPADWIAKWKGQVRRRLGRMREQILARQIELGVVPKGTKLAPKPEAIPDWETLSADEKKLFTRQAEVFAAFLDMTDHEVGRVIDAIEKPASSTTPWSSSSPATTAPAPKAAATACSTR
jgi:arylsulfatase A-like enzyme